VILDKKKSVQNIKVVLLCYYLLVLSFLISESANIM